VLKIFIVVECDSCEQFEQCGFSAGIDTTNWKNLAETLLRRCEDAGWHNSRQEHCLDCMMRKLFPEEYTA